MIEMDYDLNATERYLKKVGITSEYHGFRFFLFMVR